MTDSFWLGEAMRGEDQRSESFFSYVRLETRIPADHPLRAIRELVDAALRELSRSFDRLYAREGRPSIPPERLLGALLLQAFYTVRSERQLMEQLNYNLLFRWFVGLSADDPVWDATVFCKNRDRLLDGDIAAKFFASVLNLPQVRKLLSSEHFSVDGTLIEAWASMKSFVPKDGSKPPSSKGRSGDGGRNAERNFHGEKRKNDTHSSTTDPDARLLRKGAGKEAKLCHMGASDDGEPQWAHHRCAADRGQRHGGARDRARHDRGQCQTRQHGGRRQELRHR
jgi:transposase